jgi:23S rRNA (cytosine1962-C5)-methyltransferase
MSNYPQIQLIHDRISEHPWVYGQAIRKPDVKIPNGSIVDLVDSTGRFLARGHYSGRARIGLRVLTRDASELVDEKFFRNRMIQALELRVQQLKVRNQTDSYRLIHSEGDQLSGLVIDVYNDLAAIQYFSHGMFRHRNLLNSLVKEIVGAREIYSFADVRHQKQESFDWRGGPENLATTVRENNVRFHIQFDVHHKTGFYLDQRENRVKLAQMSAGKSVLDLCCFAGGFALAAKVAGNAERVTGIDLDPAAIALANENQKLNAAEVNFIAANIYEYLCRPELEKSHDIVVLDPAKLTASRDKLDSALSSYTLMNRLAMNTVKLGGVLLSCSCTGLVSEEEFIACIRRAAFQLGRTAQIFEVSGAASDHPFIAAAPESRYLKAVWARIL